MKSWHFYVKLHAKGFFFIFIIIVFVVYTLKSIHDKVGWRELIKLVDKKYKISLKSF